MNSKNIDIRLPVTSNEIKFLVQSKPFRPILIKMFELIMDSKRFEERREYTFNILDSSSRKLFSYNGKTRQQCALSLLNKLSDLGIELIDDIWVKYQHGTKVGKAGALSKHKGKSSLKSLIFDIAQENWLNTEMSHAQFAKHLVGICDKIPTENIQPDEFEPIDEKAAEIKNEDQALRMIKYALDKKLISEKWIIIYLKHLAVFEFHKPDLVFGLTEFSLRQMYQSHVKTLAKEEGFL